VLECITYKVAVLTYRALTGDVPQYLRQFVRVADVPSRRRLRSSTSDDLIVPAVRLNSIGSRAFPVPRACIWNTLPLHITSASSLTAFKLHLKLHLFCFSFPGLSPLWLFSGPCSVYCHLGHYKNFDWVIDCLASVTCGLTADDRDQLRKPTLVSSTGLWYLRSLLLLKPSRRLEKGHPSYLFINLNSFGVSFLAPLVLKPSCCHKS